MKKKIILLFITLFLSFSSAYANTYENPKFDTIKNNVDNNISTNPYIFPDLENATLFCEALSLEYSSYSESINL
jgi:hypothetical protein